MSFINDNDLNLCPEIRIAISLYAIKSQIRELVSKHNYDCPCKVTRDLAFAEEYFENYLNNPEGSMPLGLEKLYQTGPGPVLYHDGLVITSVSDVLRAIRCLYLKSSSMREYNSGVNFDSALYNAYSSTGLHVSSFSRELVDSRISSALIKLLPFILRYKIETEGSFFSPEKVFDLLSEEDRELFIFNMGSLRN